MEESFEDCIYIKSFLFTLFQNDLRNSNTYKGILKEIETLGPDEVIHSHIETIQLDINRTPFEADVERKRNVLYE